MDLVKLTDELVKNIVSNPDMVTTKEFASEDETEINIQVLVSASDIGRVIGKGGKIANSIRNIVQAASYIHDNKKVKINIDSF